MISLRTLKEIFINASIVILSLLLTFLLLELLTRVYKSEYSFKNFLLEEKTLFTAGYPAQYDPVLGWVPKEGASGRKNVWNTEVSIEKFGIRSNGKKEMPASSDMHPILAVGDSFAFGDQVSDGHTWPAILEMLLKKKVINGGVFGYGVDQTYLRAEQLIKIFHPSIIIFSIFKDDIDRCELSQRTAAGKPYFAVIDSKLVLKNVPVPKSVSNHAVGKLRQILGYSYFVHKFMMAFYPEFWLQGEDWLRRTRVHRDGLKVTYLLIRNLEELCRVDHIKLYVMAQYTKDLNSGNMNNIVDSFSSSTTVLIDLKPILSKIKQDHADVFERLFDEHMTVEGNYCVALILQKIITKDK